MWNLDINSGRLTLKPVLLTFILYCLEGKYHLDFSVFIQGEIYKLSSQVGKDKEIGRFYILNIAGLGVIIKTFQSERMGRV